MFHEIYKTNHERDNQISAKSEQIIIYTYIYIYIYIYNTSCLIMEKCLFMKCQFVRNYFQVVSKELVLKMFVQVLSDVLFLTWLSKCLNDNLAAVFPRGPPEKNPAMTSSTVTDRRKGDPQQMLSEQEQPRNVKTNSPT